MVLLGTDSVIRETSPRTGSQKAHMTRMARQRGLAANNSRLGISKNLRSGIKPDVIQ